LIGLTAAAVTLAMRNATRDVTEGIDKATESTDKWDASIVHLGVKNLETTETIKASAAAFTAEQRAIEEANQALRDQINLKKNLSDIAEAYKTEVITWETFVIAEAKISKREQMVVPAATAIAPIPTSVQTAINYAINATYTNPQDPASIALDMEALTLAAGR